MRQRIFRHGVAPLVLLLLAGHAWATPIETQRSHYKQALKALKAGRLTEFERLQGQLLDYPLHPYLIHARLRRDLKHADTAEVRSFLSTHGELPIADDLRRDWLRRLGREGRWQDYRHDYRNQKAADLHCFSLRAELDAGLPVELDAGNQQLWLLGRSQDKACDPVFKHWRRNGQLDSALYYQRAVNALKVGELRFSRYLSRGLGREQQTALDRWTGLYTDPIGRLPRARHWGDDETTREMIASTLIRLAPKDSERAQHLWNDLAPHFRWSDQQQLAVSRRIALMRATDYPADALGGLLALPDAAVDAQIREWRVRVALHGGDWNQVLAQLDALEPVQREQQRWRYWRARALQNTAAPDAAAELFRGLASEATYYGFLSAERSGLPYALCPRLRDVDASAVGSLMARPGLRRALELYHLDQMHNARREWQRMLRGLDPEQRRQAAVLAAAEGWHERAILTLADSGHLRQYSLRFPLAWEKRIQQEAKRRKLNPALIYGVMRSESALASDAISSAGARGLMQLTPDTGRQVARRYGLPSPSKRDLLKPEANIALGSAYLDQLFSELKHPLLVLASYNAGPEAVARWQDAGMPREADRWIETVPYHETREYLSRVLAFATIYDWRLQGRMLALSTRMADIDSSPGKSDLGRRATILPVCPDTQDH
jgi:soluble lytic murein transglycosylase